MKNIQLLLLFSLFISLQSCDFFTGLATENAEKKCGEITEPEVWMESGNSIDIHVECDLIISSLVEVDEGVSILVEDGASIIIKDGGAFEVNGRSDQLVKIFGTGNNNVPTWNGIFYNTNDLNNKLVFTEIKGAGAAPIENTAGKKSASAAVEVLGTLKMSNCLITASAEVGVLINQSDLITSDIRDFSENEINNCGEYPVLIAANNLSSISADLASCSFADNGSNMIKLYKGSENSLIGNHVWDNPGVPYYLSDELTIQGGLELNAGVEMVMQRSAEIYINSSSDAYYFKTSGTPSQQVIIRGEESGLNSWPGIWYNSNNTQNQLNNTTIIGGAVPSASSTKSAIFVSGLNAPGSSLSINNVRIEDSECALRKGPFASISGQSTINVPSTINVLCD